jgi:hypothetical protein
MQTSNAHDSAIDFTSWLEDYQYLRLKLENAALKRAIIEQVHQDMEAA